MSIIDLITELKSRDIRLWLEEGQLRFSAPKGVMGDDILDTLKSRKPEIIAFLNNTQHAGLPHIESINYNDFQPLSYAQERIWFLCLLEPGNSAFHLHHVFDIRGKLNVTSLEQALNTIIARHSILRTAYIQTEFGAYQKVIPKKTIQLHHLKASKHKQDFETIQALAQDAMDDVFNLELGDVTHACLVEVSDQHFYLFCNIHHIATDGWSMTIMGNELAELYKAYSENRKNPLTELEVQYQDFAVWQREQDDAPHLKQQLDYWKQELDHVPVISLPNDYTRPASNHSEGDTLTFVINKVDTEAIQKLSRDNHATLYMTLLSLFSILLYRYSQQETFCIGTPVAGRHSSQLEPMIGCFLNMIALKSEHQPDESFIDFLSRCRGTVRTAFANQDISFEQVVKHIAIDRNLAVSPVFQVMFAMQNMPFKSINQVKDISIESLPASKRAAIYDLSLSCHEWKGEIHAEMNYKSDLFKPETIESLINNFMQLINAVLENPQQPIMDINLVTEEDKQKQLVKWNDTRLERNTMDTIHAYIENQAKRTPEAIAIKYEHQQISYQSLNAQANQLAHYLNTIGVKESTVVGIKLDRSRELPVALLAILKAGAAYLPFDLSYPSERLDFIARDTGIAYLITSSELDNWVIPESIQRINLDQLQLDDYPEENLANQASKESLFNIIYTSGSSGQPKGVMVSHGAILNRLLWMQETFPINQEDKILQKTPYSFDVSVWEFFLP